MNTTPESTGKDSASDSAPVAPVRSGAWSWVLVGILLGLVLVLVWWRPLERGSQGTQHPAVGRPLPSMELVGLTGGAQDLTRDDLRGKVTLVNYWGPWCGPCRVEFPHLAELARKYRDDERVKIVLVSCPYADDGLSALREETEAFLVQFGVRLPIHAEARQPSGPGSDLLGGRRVFPTTLVVDGEGVVRGCWVGYAAGQEAEMAQLVADLLKPAA